MLTLVEDDNCNVSRRAEDRDISSSTTILGGTSRGSSREHKHKAQSKFYLDMIVGLLVPVLVFLDNSNNHHLEQQHVAVASPPSIIIAGGIGATSTSLPRLNRLSLSNTVVASTQEEVTPSSEAASRDAPSYRVWDLPNGSVEFHNPFIFDGLTLRSSSSVQQILESDQSSSVSETSSIALWDPIFLGR